MCDIHLSVYNQYIFWYTFVNDMGSRRVNTFCVLLWPNDGCFTAETFCLEVNYSVLEIFQPDHFVMLAPLIRMTP
jgi:hypothetical protein